MPQGTEWYRTLTLVLSGAVLSGFGFWATIGQDIVTHAELEKQTAPIVTYISERNQLLESQKVARENSRLLNQLITDMAVVKTELARGNR